MSVINSFIAQLKLSAQPEVGATEQIPNITDTQVFLRTVGNVPNDITGVTFYVSSAVPSNATISINDSTPLPLGSSIGFGYAPGNATALEDLISGLVTNPSLVASTGSIITVDVTYYARDMSPVTGGPTLSLASASVEDANPDQIVLTFSSALDGASVPATTDFTASGGKTVNNVAIAGSAITLTVDSAYINSDTITISHTPGGNPITGTNTATVGAFSNFAVTNNIAGVTDTTAPTAVLVGVLPTATTGVAATVVVDFTDETDFNPASVTIGSLSAVDGANVATIAIASTTAIGNNGVRVDFDVTAPVDGSYTVTVPVNSYSDVAGNQGALVNLGTMTASGAADTTAPTAVLVGVLPTATTGSPATITVDFDDETAFNPASVGIASLSAVDGGNTATIAIANTTTIGNNGVRVDFDVTAPVDGDYTVTVPANSYTDAAGNQGALVSLGTMTSAGFNGTFASLTAADTIVWTLAGQSNAIIGPIDGGSIAQDFGAFGDSQPWSYNVVNVGQGSTGFLRGTGAWVPSDTLANQLVSDINAANAAVTDKATLKWGPIIWFQWNSDAGATNQALYPEQLLNLKAYIEEKTGLILPWLIIKPNATSNNFNTGIQTVFTDLAGNNADIYIANIDSIDLQATPGGDGIHYSDAQYGQIEDILTAQINTDQLIREHSAANVGLPVITPAGEVFRHSFTGTLGADISTVPPDTGTIFDYRSGGEFQITSDNRAENIGTITGYYQPKPSPANIYDGIVRRIDFELQDSRASKPSATFFLQLYLRYNESLGTAGNADLNQSLVLTLFPRTTNSIVLTDNDTGSILSQENQNLNLSNAFNVVVEFSKNTIKYQLNSGTVRDLLNSTFTDHDGILLRLRNNDVFVDNFVVTEQASFTL